MILNWYGLGCFKLETANLTLCLNPFSKDPARGIPQAPRFKADAVLVSADLPEYNNVQSLSGEGLLIDSPGEYELQDPRSNGLAAGQGVFIKGLADARELAKGQTPNTIFLLKAEEISLAHLGAFKQDKLSEEVAGELENVDVLLVPVGGDMVLSAAKAANLVTRLEPSLVIPIFYKTPGLQLKLDKVESFTSELKINFTRADKLSLKKRDLLGEDTQMVLLNPQLTG